jgi:hypothetical protein
MKKVSLAFVFCSISWFCAAQQACFVSTNYSLIGGAGARGICAADFNRDGHLDLAVAAYGYTYNFMLLTGDSTGHMTSSYIHPGAGSQQIITGDFNHDSLPDVITFNNMISPGFITVFHGNGNGGFSLADSVSAKGSSFAVGDFNSDGNIDLVFLRVNLGYGDTVVILNSDSSGAFSGSEIIIDNYSSATYPSITTADLNGDNKTDLVVANGRYVYFYAGNGNNTFAPAVSFLAAPNFSETMGVFISDFNNDAKPDIAVGNIHTTTILTGDGAGNFTVLPDIANIAGSGLTAADFNGDSLIDIILTGTLAPGMMNGDGIGHFGTPYDYSVTAANLGSIVRGDFDNDGYMDFAATDGAQVHVFINSLPNDTPVVINVAVTNVTCNGANNGTATVSAQSGVSPFTYHWNLNNNSTNHITGLWPGDLNAVTVWVTAGNGCIAKQTDTISEPAVLSVYVTGSLPCGADASLTANPVGGTAPYSYLWYNLTPVQHTSTVDITTPGYYKVKVTDANNCTVITNQFYVQTKPHLQPYNIINTPGGSQSIAVADFDKNGVKDLVVAEKTTGQVTILNGTGGGTFGIAGNYYACTSAYLVFTADYNGDSFDDIAVFQEGGLSDSVFFLYGNGSFTFSNPVPLVLPVSYWNSGVNAAASVDINRDGKTDIVVASVMNKEIAVLLNNGNGTFTNYPLTSDSSLHTGGIAVADLNNDSLPDLITADEQIDSISVFLGYGNGYFQAPYHFATGSYPTAVSTADFNHDGKTDIAVVCGFGSNLQLQTLAGDGTGVFFPGITLAVGSTSIIACNDFDGDSIADIALAYSGAVIFPGAGNGTFNPPAYYTSSSISPSSIIASDINNDGLPDILLTDFTRSQTDVLLTCGNPASIKNIEQPVSFELFPNPAGNSVTVSVDYNMIGNSVSVTDVTGRIVFKSEMSNPKFEINVSAFSAGVYFVGVGTATGKLVIER